MGIYLPHFIRQGLPTLLLRWTYLLSPDFWQSRAIQAYLKWVVSMFPAVPNLKARSSGNATILAEPKNGSGRTVRAILHTPEGYRLTMLTAVTIVEPVLTGQRRAGFITPEGLFDPDTILQIEGVSREDLL